MKLFTEVPIEKVSEYWNTRPCNIRHSAKEVGSREYFDEVEHRKYFVEPHIPGFAEFKKWTGKKVLEIGCGIGTDTMNFARAGAQVTAVDYSKASLEIARKRADIYGLDIQFYHANAEELSHVVPVDRYDLVYSFGVIHHTPHPEKAVAELHKYMDSESTLKLMVYHRNAWKVFWILLRHGKGQFWKMDDLIADYSEAQTGCPVTYAYTPKTVKRLLRGFEIQKCDIEHIFPYQIPEYKKYEYVKTWYFRYLPDSMMKWLEHHFGWHLCITAHKSREVNIPQQ